MDSAQGAVPAPTWHILLSPSTRLSHVSPVETSRAKALFPGARAHALVRGAGTETLPQLS